MSLAFFAAVTLDVDQAVAVRVLGVEPEQPGYVLAEIGDGIDGSRRRAFDVDVQHALAGLVVPAFAERHGHDDRLALRRLELVEDWARFSAGDRGELLGDAGRRLGPVADQSGSIPRHARADADDLERRA